MKRWKWSWLLPPLVLLLCGAVTAGLAVWHPYRPEKTEIYLETRLGEISEVEDVTVSGRISEFYPSLQFSITGGQTIIQTRKGSPSPSDFSIIWSGGSVDRNQIAFLGDRVFAVRLNVPGNSIQPDATSNWLAVYELTESLEVKWYSEFVQLSWRNGSVWPEPFYRQDLPVQDNRLLAFRSVGDQLALLTYEQGNVVFRQIAPDHPEQIRPEQIASGFSSKPKLSFFFQDDLVLLSYIDSKSENRGIERLLMENPEEVLFCVAGLFMPRTLDIYQVHLLGYSRTEEKLIYNSTFPSNLIGGRPEQMLLRDGKMYLVSPCAPFTTQPKIVRFSEESDLVYIYHEYWKPNYLLAACTQDEVVYAGEIRSPVWSYALLADYQARRAPGSVVLSEYAYESICLS